jgi:hypothetical protein
MHRNARPKPKGWLLAVLDSIYKDGGPRAAAVQFQCPRQLVA